MEWQNYLVNQGLTNDDIISLKLGAILVIFMIVSVAVLWFAPPHNLD